MSENLPVNWQEAMAQEAKAVAKAFRPTTGQISTRGGVLSYMDQPIPGNKLSCIILAAIFENNLFEGRFDPKNPRNPICYAFGRVQGDGSKPPMIPYAEIKEPVAASCDECPNSKWASDPNSPSGKGKLCKEIYKLAVVPASTILDESAKTEIAILRVPVTSRKNFEVFINEAASTLQRPSWGVVADISLHPNPRTQFEMKFAAKEAIPESYLAGIYPRIPGAFDVLMQKYEENTEQKQPEPERTGRKKY